MIRAALLILLACANLCAASPESDKAAQLLAEGDLTAARTYIEKELNAGSTSNRLLYEYARLHALLDDQSAAGRVLVAAVAAGFTDFFALSRDTALRDLAEAQAILTGRKALLDDRARADFEAVKRAFPKNYRFVRDETLRLQFASAFDETITEEILTEARALLAWIHDELWDAPPDPALDPWVTVILPTPEDFIRLVGTAGVGGYYDPEARRLVSADLGPSLRHELMHVYHFRRLERLGQRRPHWFTEGLAALPEDLDPTSPAFTPVGSWRTDIAKRRLAAGRLRKWPSLFAQDKDRFVGHRPKAQYAQSRAIVMHLHASGALKDTINAFEQTYGADPLGFAAIEAATNQPARRAELAFRGWLATLSTHEPDAIKETKRLGLTLTAGRGDGPEVQHTDSRSPAKAAKLRRRDIIRAVNNRPVRTITEFLRAVSPPAEHTLTIRRGRATLDLTLTTPAD